MILKIRKNDTVKVIAGKERGKQGKVLKVFPKERTAIVEGINFFKRHTRANPSRNIKGGILEKEGPIHISNLMVICSECGKVVRVGHRILDDGKKIRICRKCGGMIGK
ncbi:MAG: 50S ribosomal protein L24 [Acidobacteriota bacterium]